jgi:paraquat-inducible protein B
MRPRVDITFFPERLIARLPAGQESAVQTVERNREKREAVLRRLVEERGLRAQLRTGSLLTGQKYVALDYFPKAPKARVNWAGKEPELPVVPGLRPDVEQKLTSILAKLDKLPLGRSAESQERLGNLGPDAEEREPAGRQRRYPAHPSAEDRPRRTTARSPPPSA